MTATTSKLGADMNDPEMNTLVIQTATAAGLRVNVDGKMLNDNYTNVMGSFPSLVRFARALLARQPAAIGKPAAPSVEQDERGASFEEWIESVPPLAWENWGRREAAHAAWQARAASTSANVAQGAEAVAGADKALELLQALIPMTENSDSPVRNFHETLKVIRDSLTAAPPAQTALTDGQVIKQADHDSCANGYGVEDGTGVAHDFWWTFDRDGLLKFSRALTAAQSASGDTK